MDQAQVIQALEFARHELTVAHGLMAFDGTATQVTWPIDSSKAVALIDSALNQFANTDDAEKHWSQVAYHQSERRRENVSAMYQALQVAQIKSL